MYYLWLVSLDLYRIIQLYLWGWAPQVLDGLHLNALWTWWSLLGLLLNIIVVPEVLQGEGLVRDLVASHLTEREREDQDFVGLHIKVPWTQHS
jgi:hypothetical protein